MRLSIQYNGLAPDGVVSEIIEVPYQYHPVSIGETIFVQKYEYGFNGVVQKIHHIFATKPDGSAISNTLVTVRVYDVIPKSL